MIKKYLKGVEVVFWLRTNNNKFLVASNFWKNFMGSLHLVKRWLTWLVGNGTRVQNIQDPFIGCDHMYKLSDALVRHLNDLQVYSFTHITYTSSLNSSNTQDWLSLVDLGLEGEMAIEWSGYMEMLRNSGVTIKSDADLLVWSWNNSLGTMTAKFSYDALTTWDVVEDPIWWYQASWKVKIPYNLILLM